MRPFIKNGPLIGMRLAIRWIDEVRGSSFREVPKNTRSGNLVEA